ncbi:parathyroid hormone 4 [Eucyclogobius newberryi]|uniref:parathyroid hormone 4 n=1 Tax=Eucyclogobius newberryi TaxID=166745 RepID=UPI003B5BA7AC
MLFTSGLCQSDSRRAVSEHQLMHDRGRTVQSLKRLIWLSSAIEGLHTAQARGLAPEREVLLSPGLDQGLDQGLDLEPANTEPMKSLLREFIKSVKQ